MLTTLRTCLLYMDSIVVLNDPSTISNKKSFKRKMLLKNLKLLKAENLDSCGFYNVFDPLPLYVTVYVERTCVQVQISPIHEVEEN